MNEWLYYIAGCFYYFSSTINPILYNLMSVKYRLAFRQTLCGYRYERNRSRDLHSSFKETIIQTNESHWKRTLTWRQSSKKSIKSNGTDVVVMIAPAAGNESTRRATVNWRKTFLRVAMGSRLSKNTSPDHCSEVVVSLQEETCIWKVQPKPSWGFSSRLPISLFSKKYQSLRCAFDTRRGNTFGRFVTLRRKKNKIVFYQFVGKMLKYRSKIV